MKDIIAQGFGIIGLIIIVLSFQSKKNSRFFLMQGLGSLMFSLNFLLIGAWGGALFNLCNVLRGTLYLKDAKKTWKLIVVETAYTACFVFSVFVNPDPIQIILAAIPCAALVADSVVMWLGNDKHIRYCQIAFMSPSWIIHNIFNISIGGLLCESFNMVSSAIYLVRMKQEEKENKAF